jgi:hypothetical protein
MRPFLAAALLLSPGLLSQCSHAPATSPVAEKPAATPAADTSAAATDPAGTHTTYASQLGPLDPSPSQQPVQPDVLMQEPDVYAAALPVLRDKDGSISVRVATNPKTHSVQKLETLFIPLDKAVTLRQFGEGIGRYDAATGRYYFSTMYQKTRRLSAGLINQEALRQITGWVAPGTSEAAVAEAAVPDEAVPDEAQ